MRDLSNPLSESVFDKDKRKERKNKRKERREHNRAARKTEGSRVLQYIRKLKNRQEKY